MYTIKEVAAAAGVSVGTVSNVINGKTRNTELIERVEKVIKDLSYRPDANARSLKNTKSEMIGVVLPDLVHPGHAIFLASMTQRLQDKGYALLLKISRNNRHIERQCVEQCVEKRVDGLIIHSPLDMCGLASVVPDAVPVVCVTDEEETDPRFRYVRIDYTVAFHDALKNLGMMGIRNVGMLIDGEALSEGGLEAAYYRAFGKQNRKYLRLVDGSRERGFKAAYELVFNHPEIEGIIAGSPLIARGVAKALDILGRTEIPITAVKDGNWIEDEGGFSGFISLSHDALAADAVDALAAGIESAPNTGTATVSAGFEAVPTLTGGLARGSGKIHFAMFDCPAAQALVMLSGVYSRQTGVNVSFDLLKYSALEKRLYSNDHANLYDGYMFDIVWLRDLTENGVLLPLEDYHGMDTPVNSGFLDNALVQYCVYDGLLLGLPFMSGAELLYYQRSLFEDQWLGRLYERRHDAPLRPPATWEEFNTVGKFFTQAFNPDSPVKHGMTTVSGRNMNASIVFLSYLWSYGGDLFDVAGNVVINSPEATLAVNRFLESFACSGEPAATHALDDAVDRFQTGNYAMAILYDSHAVNLNDYTKSPVAGNLGYTTIPGGIPVMGGWSLGLCPEARNRPAALEFIRWACGDRSAVPLSLLGGSPLRKGCFEREDIRIMYPWNAITEKNRALSRQRTLPNGLAGVIPQSRVYVDILFGELVKCIHGGATAEKALREIERKLNLLVKKNVHS